MKRILSSLSLFSLLILLSILTACDKISQDSMLEGMWQLTELTPATTAIPQDKRAEAIYWSFQLQMMQIHTPSYLHNGKTSHTVGLFDRDGDLIHIRQVAIHYANRDSLITDTSSTTLDQVGIHGTHADFQIERLSHRQLILQSDFCRLVLKKI